MPDPNKKVKKGVELETGEYVAPDLPLILPLNPKEIGGIDDGFGDARGARAHLATDIYANNGVSVRSAANVRGEVVAVGGKETVTPEQRSVYNKWKGGGRNGNPPKMNYSSGKFATVRYISEERAIFYITYWHLSSINVNKGDEVKPNETVIGKVGKTGTTVEHLHMAVYFSMKKEKEGVKYFGYVNPINYLREDLKEAGITPKYKCRLCEQGRWDKRMDSKIYWYDANVGRFPPEKKDLNEHLKKIGIEPPDQTKVIIMRKKEEPEKRKLAIA